METLQNLNEKIKELEAQKAIVEKNKREQERKAFEISKKKKFIELTIEKHNELKDFSIEMVDKLNSIEDNFELIIEEKEEIAKAYIYNFSTENDRSEELIYEEKYVVPITHIRYKGHDVYVQPVKHSLNYRHIDQNKLQICGKGVDCSILNRYYKNAKTVVTKIKEIVRENNVLKIHQDMHKGARKYWTEKIDDIVEFEEITLSTGYITHNIKRYVRGYEILLKNGVKVRVYVNDYNKWSIHNIAYPSPKVELKRNDIVNNINKLSQIRFNFEF